MNKDQQEKDPLISQIADFTRQMNASAYDQISMANAAQREADRYQEMSNIMRDMGQRQSDAATRLTELANGGDGFKLPAMFQDQNGYGYGHQARQ